jgi:preprotein translocase subunit SecY
MTGAIPALVQSVGLGDPTTATLMITAIASTIVVFAIAVFSQAMKVEIPLSFGRIRGHGIRWPLSFMYTSNIPVILIAALLANIQLWAGLMENWAVKTGGGIVSWISINVFGQLNTVDAGHGLVQFISPPNIVGQMVQQGSIFIGWSSYKVVIIYMLIMMVGAMIFSIFWMQTSGQDARSVAKQMMSSGLQLPGFRRDERVLERVLNRYIWPLTVMGGLAIGFLAAIADVSGALSSGTGLLLAVMIIYRLYEEIAKQHMMDMNPLMRKFME